MRQPSPTFLKQGRKARSAGGAGKRADDVVHDLVNQAGVFALGHDADHRLGPRCADHQPAVSRQAVLALADGGAYLGIVERRAGRFR